MIKVRDKKDLRMKITYFVITITYLLTILIISKVLYKDLTLVYDNKMSLSKYGIMAIIALLIMLITAIIYKVIEYKENKINEKEENVESISLSE